jgi:hypothetical protein
MTLNGICYSPIEVCKAGGVHFVVNGHHRVSVASYLKWRTIQARVSELPPSAVLQARVDALARGRWPGSRGSNGAGEARAMHPFG